MAVQAMLGGEPDPAEYLLAVAGRGERGVAGRRLCEHRAEVLVRRGVRGGQRGLGALERDERLGEPVPDGLEARERTAELNHGAYGYSAEFVVERLYRDAPLMAIGEGTNDIQRLVIARSLISGTGRLGW